MVPRWIRRCRVPIYAVKSKLTICSNLAAIILNAKLLPAATTHAQVIFYFGQTVSVQIQFSSYLVILVQVLLQVQL